MQPTLETLSDTSGPPSDPRPRRSYGRWGGAALLALVLVGTWWLIGRQQSAPAAPAPPKVPVAVERVEVDDVPHVSAGIGTVTSLHSVTLRSQVDGILTAVLFKEGQNVRKGELLARIDDRAIVAAVAQAKAQKSRNQAELHAARADLTRFQNLLKEEAISRQAIDQQNAKVEQLRATIEANDATIAAEEVRLSFTRITAPVTGRVGLRRVDPGNVVRASDPEGLVTVTQMDPIAVIFTLPQDMLGRVTPLLQNPEGAPVTALDRDQGTVIAKGKLAMIDNQIDAASGTIRVKAEFANPEGRLWPGQFVTVRLQTGATPRALVVAARAVQRGLNGTFVFRIRNGKAEVVPVTVALETDGRAVLTAGVAAGDEVVVDGQSRLKPGAGVKVVPGPSPPIAPERSPAPPRQSSPESVPAKKAG
ncbi:MAG TPA: efflux RND transporter periplasmic adaptor subunit [Polyangia bacterium]